MSNSLRKNISNIQRNNRFSATVVEVINNIVSVKLNGNGKIIRGLSFTGQRPVPMQSVVINYSSGKPFIETNSVLAAVDIVSVTSSTSRTMIEQPDPSASVDVHHLDGGQADSTYL